MLSRTLQAAGGGNTGHQRLSPARQRLIDLFNHIHFGRVLDLQVRGGEPVLQANPPHIVRTVKLSGTNQLRARATTDPLLKPEIHDLLRLLDELGDGLVGRIEVAHGVPLFAEVHESAPADGGFPESPAAWSGGSDADAAK